MQNFKENFPRNIHYGDIEFINVSTVTLRRNNINKKQWSYILFHVKT